MNRSILSLCIVLGASVVNASPPTPGQLLLDVKTRAQFAAQWGKSTVTVHYHPPLLPGQDARYRTSMSVRGAILEGDGKMHVVAPTARLFGATWVELELFDGRRIPARLQPLEGSPRDIPLMRVIPRRPMTGVEALKWAPPSTGAEGLRVWGVSHSASIMPGGRAVPILIDGALGKPVESPLERFRYVGVGRVDGLALLNRHGAVVCIVFRAVPGMQDRSLCTPRAAAFTEAVAKRTEATSMKLRTYGARKAEP